MAHDSPSSDAALTPLRHAARTSSSRGSALLVIALFSTFLVPDLTAQRRGSGSVELGIRGGYDFQVDDLLLGGQVLFPLARGSKLVAGGDWIFTPGSNFQMNLDLLLPLGPNGGLYGGGGLGAAIVDENLPASQADVTVGGNIVLGLAPYRWGRRGPRWFIEARWFLRSGDDPFRLVLGFSAPLGG